MKTVKLLTVTALTSSLVVATGCAGKGLKGMFSRNETAGYSTLEELDAKEAAKSKGEVADSSGPRFAPWLPFGKDKAADNTVAAAETPSATAPTDDAAKKGLFRNPFRKQETIEPDPFLNDQSAATVADSATEGNESEATSSKTRATTRTASMSKELGVAGGDAVTEEMPEIAARPASRKTPSTKTVSASAPATGKSEETDAELVERFEKHFQKNTLEAAEEADQLIVAGKQAGERKSEAAARTAAKKPAPATTEADRKLAELEEILKARKGQSSNRVSRAVAEESKEADKANETIRQLSGRASEQAARRTSKAAKTAATAETAANRQFDQLFDAASQRMTDDSSGHAVVSDVPVASADELFGRPAVNRQADVRSNRTASEKPVRSVSSRRNVAEEEQTQEDTPAVTPSSDSAESKGFRWQSQNLRSRSRQFLQDTVKQSAATASGLARENGLADFLPPAQAPDVPEPSARHEAAPLMIPGDSGPEGSGGAIVATPAGLKEDNFFAASAPIGVMAKPNEEGTVSETAVSEVSAASPSTSGLLNRISMRSWLLLIGGAVVVALLYLPGRKNAASATTAQI